MLTLSKVEPLCPVFGVCGGCAYQDIPYPEELAIKGRNLKELLAGKFALDESVFEPVVPSPEPYHYRHRLDLSFKKRALHEYEMGFQLPGSSRLVPVESCAIARKEIVDFMPELKKQALARVTEKYRTANLVVRTGDDGRVLWGGIGRRSLELLPKDYLWTEVRGRKIFYSLDTFFQANLSILPVLMDKIESLYPFNRETIFFDLYSGVGLFGICFAPQVAKVVMMEESPSSVSLANFNAAYHGFKNIKIYQGLVESQLAAVLKETGEGPKIAFVDPPRKGLAPAALETLAASRAFEALFYLSCQPESLARDLEKFVSEGWKIEKIVPFDFFPKTSHLETLVVLTRPKTEDQRQKTKDDSILDFYEIFGNANPVEVEIGCGKGKFLVARALENPGINFLGLDRAVKWMKTGIKNSDKQKLANVHFLQAEIRALLERIPGQSVSLFHIYFPDPWPKRRHRKHRIVTPEFLEALDKKLAAGGSIELATDHEDYFEQMKKSVALTASLWSSVRECENQRLKDPHLKTNYELKYETEGRNLYYLEMVKP